MGAKKRMLISYVAGEECRVAMVVDDRLEELHSERANAVSYVGNIYVGKVINVEAGIQAAFIDFGHEQNGFLHISDLHPSYFPGADEEDTEKIGRKTPRRERPPIQQCLKRGQQVIVQVLKEGISTKGPTLTTYLSIPGRYLVMLPGMDKVGVSRKVEDEDIRKAMRAQLDGLDLPDGYGFILRTAGMDRPKTELKRDLAYLQRLTKDIEKRQKTGGNKPRLLYAESDLLMRSLRDQWTADVDEIVIDDEHALQRAWRFMKIVSPRASTKLLHFDRTTPLFHAYGIEEQISLMLAREVPLPSGGSIVIDETEAMIAIDVNSGRMRSNRDAETTAFKTNVEAVDEICRQLRLRDIGGLVVCDLIDMMSRSNRRQIESRFRDRLKNDRASTKVLPISQFGIVEMTRQRQRESQRKVHFAPCPRCEGRGVLKRPASVAAEALRELARLLDAPQVQRVEMVVSPRVAGELLSAKRQTLIRIEQESGRQADVRVSEDIPVDRVAFYAYRADGSDLDVERLPKLQAPNNLKVWTSDDPIEDDWAVDMRTEGDDLIDEEHAVPADEEGQAIVEASQRASASDDGQQGEGGRKKRRRRRGGRGRNKNRNAEAAEANAAAPSDHAGGSNAPTMVPVDDDRASSWDVDPAEAKPAANDDAPDADDSDEAPEPTTKKKRRRSRSKKKTSTATEPSRDEAPEAEARSDDSPDDEAPKKKSRRKRSKKKASSSAEAPKNDAQPKEAKPDAPAVKVVAPKRSLYGSNRRRLKPGDIPARRDD
ncbi:MAG: Rne/Rng family ribonuclease [Phycisphaerales bacterium]